MEIIGLQLLSFADWQTEVQERDVCSKPQDELETQLRFCFSFFHSVLFFFPSSFLTLLKKAFRGPVSLNFTSLLSLRPNKTDASGKEDFVLGQRLELGVIGVGAQRVFRPANAGGIWNTPRCLYSAPLLCRGAGLPWTGSMPWGRHVTGDTLPSIPATVL